LVVERFEHPRLEIEVSTTNTQLAQAGAHINSLDPMPDIMIPSRDLTEHGLAEEST
jgi:hypothetical protein